MNREQTRILQAVADEQVYRSAGAGVALWRNGKQRVDRSVRYLLEAGYIAEPPAFGEAFTITNHGYAALTGEL